MGRDALDVFTDKDHEPLDAEEDQIKEWNWLLITEMIRDEPVSVQDFVDVKEDVSNLSGGE